MLHNKICSSYGFVKIIEISKSLTTSKTEFSGYSVHKHKTRYIGQEKPIINALQDRLLTRQTSHMTCGQFSCHAVSIITSFLFKSHYYTDLMPELQNQAEHPSYLLMENQFCVQWFSMNQRHYDHKGHSSWILMSLISFVCKFCTIPMLT